MKKRTKRARASRVIAQLSFLDTRNGRTKSLNRFTAKRNTDAHDNRYSQGRI